MAAAVMPMDDTLILQAVAGVSEAISRCIVPRCLRFAGPKAEGARLLQSGVADSARNRRPARL